VGSAIPLGGCTKLTFGVAVPCAELRGEFLPGDVSMNGTVNTQDLLALIQCLNGTLVPVGLPTAPRCDINRNGVANTQDLLRLVQLLNGVNSTRVWNGVTLVPCD